jgi:hypothetical protein
MITIVIEEILIHILGRKVTTVISFNLFKILRG